MPDQIDSQRILFTGGLNTSQNFLLLSNTNPGFGTRLVNYETAFSGGYRRINGYTLYDSVAGEVTNGGDTGTGAILGIWGYLNGSTFEIYAARKKTATTEYKIYRLNPGVGWTTVVTGTTQTVTGVTQLRTVTFSTQTKRIIAIVDGVNKALLFDGTTWYQVSSLNAGGTGSPGGNQTLDAPAVVEYFRGSLFFGSDATTPAVLAYSAPNDPFTWTAAAGGGQQLPGFNIVQIKPFRDELFVFGTQAIKKSIADESAGFVLQDVTKNLGCISRDSVQEINSNIVFFAPDGIRTVAGTDKIGDVDVGPFSENIRNTITDIIANYDLSLLRSVSIRNKTQFRYFINNNTSTKDDAYGLLSAYRHAEDQWEFFELNGFQVSSTWSGYNAAGLEKVIHGDFTGNIFLQESGTTFNGSDITSIYVSPFIDLGDTTVRKLFRRIDLFTRSEGTFTGTLEVDFDWDDDNVIRPDAYSLNGTGSASLYDAGILYDNGATYAGTSQPVFKQNIQGSAFSIQIGFTVSGNYSSHTLQGYVIDYSVKGRE